MDRYRYRAEQLGVRLAHVLDTHLHNDFVSGARELEATPTLLIHNGRILEDNLARERVTREDLLAALRRNGLIEPAEVRFAVLEENGGISVVPHAPGQHGGGLPGVS